MNSGGDVGPAATMLGQIAVMSGDAGVQPPSSLASLLEKVSARLEGGIAALFRATSSPNSKPSDLFELHRSLERFDIRRMPGLMLTKSCRRLNDCSVTQRRRETAQLLHWLQSFFPTVQ